MWYTLTSIFSLFKPKCCVCGLRINFFKVHMVLDMKKGKIFHKYCLTFEMSKQ